MSTAFTKLISRVSSSVLSLEEAKSHLRILGTAQDTLVSTCLNAAVQWAETRTERVLSQTTYQLRIEPMDGTLVLPFPDFKEITKIETISGGTKAEVYNAEGPVGTLSDYVEVDDFPNPAELTFTTANLDEDVDYLLLTLTFQMTVIPEDLKAAIKLLLGHLFQNSSEVVTGTIASQMPLGAETILSMHTFKRYG